MSEWKKSTLSQACSDISYGYTASATQEPVGPKFLRITDIVPKQIDWFSVPFCEADISTFEKYKLKNGDIVIARTGATTGYNKTIKNLSHNTVYASYLIRYQIDKKKADPYFVGHVLQSTDWYGYVEAIAGGSAQPGANAKQLGSFEFKLPPLTEQKAIASVLSSLDDKIDLLHRQNKTLEALAETLFRQWFVEEEQEDWEEGKLGDYADHIKAGVTPANNPMQTYTHYSLPAFDEGMRPVVELGGAILSNKYSVMPWSILVSKLNPRFPRIWPIGDEPGENAICSTEFQVFKPKNGNLYGYLYYLLKSKDAREELLMAASGTSGSHQRVRPEDILNIGINLPSIALAKQYSEIVEPGINKLMANLGQIQSLETLRDTLLPKLMSGDVRVSL